MVTAHQTFLALALLACVAAAVIDLRTGTIPNWLTGGLIGAGAIGRVILAAHAGEATPWHEAALACGAAILAGLLPALMYRAGGLGGGDVKLFMGIGASCGMVAGLSAQTWAYVVALVWALAVLTRRGALRSTLANVARLLSGRRRESASQNERHAGFTEMRFGPAILAGMCIAAWQGWSLR